MKELLIGHDRVVAPWVYARAGGEWKGEKCSTIGLLSLGEGLIAGVVYEDFNGANISMHVAARPGCRWLDRNFLWTCFHYPFVQLGVKRITGVVPASNLPARRFDEHLGFVLEATLQDAHPSGDLLIYKMTKDQCRWLKLKEDRNVNRKSQGSAGSELRSCCDGDLERE